MPDFFGRYDFTVVETISFPADEFFPHEALKDESGATENDNGKFFVL